MKTLEELYNEVAASEELREEFIKAAETKETLEDFLRKYDCEATVEEVAGFLKGKMDEEGKLSDEELDAVAGGSKEAARDFAKGFINIITFGKVDMS